MTTSSTQLYLAVPRFRMPIADASNARVAANEIFEPIVDFRAQTEIPMVAPKAQSKPAKTGSESLGLSLVVLLVLGIGTAWAWIVVQVALMVAGMEPLLVRNILWTHQ